MGLQDNLESLKRLLQPKDVACQSPKSSHISFLEIERAVYQSKLAYYLQDIHRQEDVLFNLKKQSFSIIKTIEGKQTIVWENKDKYVFLSQILTGDDDLTAMQFRLPETFVSAIYKHLHLDENKWVKAILRCLSNPTGEAFIREEYSYLPQKSVAILFNFAVDMLYQLVPIEKRQHIAKPFYVAKEQQEFPENPHIQVNVTAEQTQLMIKDVVFNQSAHADICQRLIQSSGNLIGVDAIVFDDCYFDSDLDDILSKVSYSIVFRNCQIKCPFNFTQLSRKDGIKKIELTGNDVFAKMTFNIKENTALDIQRNYFDADGVLEINALYDRVVDIKAYPNATQTIRIEKNIFRGRFKCQGLSFNYNCVFSDLTFCGWFSFSNCVFHKDCIIKNWSFPLLNKKVNESRERIVEVLNSAGIINNEMVLSAKQDAEQKALSDKLARRAIDPSIYEAQLLSHELDNKSTAVYLGISPSKLEHMRSQDKKKIRRWSIPCYYNAIRHIFYHKDALDAFKGKDFATLKLKQQEYREEWQEVLDNKK